MTGEADTVVVFRGKIVRKGPKFMDPKNNLGPIEAFKGWIRGEL